MKLDVTANRSTRPITRYPSTLLIFHNTYAKFPTSNTSILHHKAVAIRSISSITSTYSSPLSASKTTIPIPMPTIILPKLTLVPLVVTAPILSIVRHPNRIAIDIRRRKPKREGQRTTKLLCLATRDPYQFLGPYKFLVAIVQRNVKAVHRRIYALGLVLLVPPDMQSAPTAVVRVAVVLGDVFLRDAFHHLGFYVFDGTAAECVSLMVAVKAAFSRGPTAGVVYDGLEAVGLGGFVVCDEGGEHVG
jgi:hypothetical protein